MNQSEPLYCLDDLRCFLTAQDIIAIVPLIATASENIYRVFDPKSGQPSLLATKTGLDEILARIAPSEAKALRYIIFHGVGVQLGGQGEVLFHGKDVANCFGYANPYRAVKKYCKSVVGGYIPEADVYRLADRSKLANAGRVRAWIANGATQLKWRASSEK